MLVAMWMTRKPVTIAPTTSIGEAAALMARRRFRHVLVTDERTAALRGIVSLHDLARAFPADFNPLSAAAATGAPAIAVGDVMTAKPATVTPATPIEDAARLMLDHKFNALPVVQGDAVVGILTESDVLRAFVEMVGPGDRGGTAETASARITFDVSDSEDAVAFIVELARTRQSRVASILTMVHDGKRLAIARVSGGDVDGLVGAVWRSGHRVLSVVQS
jgi:acetoin utilization protein AcuB